jgi:hypothetical protein
VRPVAIAGLGDIDPNRQGTSMVAATWVLVLGVTMGIWFATLAIDPPRKKGSK